MNTNENEYRPNGDNNESPAILTTKKSHTAILPGGRVAFVPDILDEPKLAPERLPNRPTGRDVLRIIPLGGQEKGGGANMIVFEYGNDAIVTDAGHNLGVELPGVNYSIPNIEYLEKIKHKVRGYIFTHGHLDHIGAIPHILPKVPAPLYGTRFTVGMLHKEFEEMPLPGGGPKMVTMDLDNHHRVKIGPFTVELVRVTHSIPEASAVIIDTPVGRVINTGDFRLDPEPLDAMPTDVARLTQLGNEGVLMLLSESTTTGKPGRTPTEATLQPTFLDLMDKAKGRIIVASFASNVNRIQMIITAAVKSGRKVAIVGRSMLAHVELAVKLGILKVPAGTIVRAGDMARLRDNQVMVICTGGQGEDNAALSRMSRGDDKHIKIKANDTVLFSSTPIPYTGNDESVRLVVDGLMKQGAQVFRHTTHELDHHGPLHVSGHASSDEFAEMIKMTKPKYFMPIYGDYQSQIRHIDIATKLVGLDPNACITTENGDVLEVNATSCKKAGQVASGAVMIDNTGAIVPGIVIKDRLGMMENGILIVILTLDAKSKQLVASPDIITRGFIQISENQDLMRDLRLVVKKFTSGRIAKAGQDAFKMELRDKVSDFLYKKTKQNPIVIPVINLIGANGESNIKARPVQDCA